MRSVIAVVFKYLPEFERRAKDFYSHRFVEIRWKYYICKYKSYLNVIIANHLAV